MNENEAKRKFHCCRTSYCLLPNHKWKKSSQQIKKWCSDGAMQPNYKLLQAVTLIRIRLFDRFSISFLSFACVLGIWKSGIDDFRHLFMWFLLFGSCWRLCRINEIKGIVKRDTQKSELCVAVKFFHGSFTIWIQEQ